MTSNQMKFIGIILIIILLVADILTRLFYCSYIYLKFDSQEFNNILSPIISFLGFIGVIITILLTLKQFKHQQGSNYFNYYRDHINMIANENPIKDNTVLTSTVELLDFPIYLWNKFEDLKKYPEYFEDLEKFIKGEIVNSENKGYDAILGTVRLYSASLNILIKRYISLIIEIDNHENLDPSQKGLLLKDLFDSQVEKYYNSCWLIEFDPELKEVKDNLYCAFAPVLKDKLLVYNHDFYKLKRMIDKRPDLKKFTESNLLDEK